MIRINIKVQVRAKTVGVEQQADGSYRVRVKEPAERGRANEAVIDMLAEYFKLPKSKIQIIKGSTASRKIVQIGE